MVKEYQQNSNNATYAKWVRMCHNRRWVASTRYLQVGFSDWSLTKNEQGDWVIKASSTYHVESTLDDMYKHNFSNWK